jgi:hypothetical protein
LAVDFSGPASKSVLAIGDSWLVSRKVSMLMEE